MPTKLTEDADCGTSDLHYLSYAQARRFRNAHHPREAIVSLDGDDSGTFAVPRLSLRRHAVCAQEGRHLICLPESAAAARRRHGRTCLGFAAWVVVCGCCCAGGASCCSSHDADEADDDESDEEGDGNGDADADGSKSREDARGVSSSADAAARAALRRRRQVLSSRGVVGDYAQYGMGVALYFKALRFLASAFFVMSMIALAPLLVFRASSDAGPASTVSSPASPLFSILASFSVGALGDTPAVCASGFAKTDKSLTVSCSPGSVIRAVEATFGAPRGECSCPAPQTPSPTCPGSVDSESGTCAPKSAFCFVSDVRQVQLPSGASFSSGACCSSSLSYGKPDFSALDISPDPTGACAANAGFVNAVARGLCIGRSSCTVNLSPGATQSWKVATNLQSASSADTQVVGLSDTSLRTPCVGIFDSLTRTCSAALGNASGLTGCVDSPNATSPWAFKSARGPRLVLVAKCVSDGFKTPPWLAVLRDGTVSKADAVLVAEVCSVLAMVVLTFAACLLRAREARASSRHISPSDYTVMVSNLPVGAGLLELERSLRTHFESVLQRPVPDQIAGNDDERFANRQAEAIACTVADVNFGVGDAGGVLSLFAERGKLLRKLERLGRLELIADAQEKWDLRDSTRALVKEVILHVEECDKKIDSKAVPRGTGGPELPLRAVCAFVTFNEAEGARRALTTYPPGLLPWLFMPKSVKFGDDQTRRLWVTSAPEPSDINWVNISLPTWKRGLLQFATLAITAAALLAASSLVFLLADMQRQGRRNYPSVDCAALLARDSRLGATPNGTMAAYNLVGGRFDLSQDDVGAAEGGFSRLGVLVDYYFRDLGLPSGNSGALGCWCTSLAASRGVSSLLSDSFPSLLPPNATLATASSRDTLCESWLYTFVYVSGLSYGGSLLTLVINSILTLLVYALARLERHWNRTSELKSRALYLLAVQVINTGLLVLLLNANLPSGEALLRGGQYSDFSASWHSTVGASLVLTMLINVVLPHALPVADTIVASCRRCADRGCSCDRSRTRSLTQAELNMLQLGPELAFDVRYAQIFTSLFVCVTYAAGQPLLLPIAFLSIAGTLVVDKALFSLSYRKPPFYTSALPHAFTRVLPAAGVFHLFLGAWMLSNDSIFPTQATLSESVAVAQLATALGPASGSALRRAISVTEGFAPLGLRIGWRVSSTQSLPLFVFGALLAIWFLASMLGSLLLPRFCLVCKGGRGQVRGKARPSYLMAVPPDEVEAVVNEVRIVKPQLRLAFKDAFQRQSRTQAREQLAHLVEQFEASELALAEISAAAVKAKADTDRLDAEVDELLKSGTVPATAAQIFADSHASATRSNGAQAEALHVRGGGAALLEYMSPSVALGRRRREAQRRARNGLRASDDAQADDAADTGTSDAEGSGSAAYSESPTPADLRDSPSPAAHINRASTNPFDPPPNQVLVTYQRPPLVPRTSRSVGNPFATPRPSNPFAGEDPIEVTGALINASGVGTPGVDTGTPSVDTPGVDSAIRTENGVGTCDAEVGDSSLSTSGVVVVLQSDGDATARPRRRSSAAPVVIAGATLRDSRGASQPESRSASRSASRAASVPASRRASRGEKATTVAAASAAAAAAAAASDETEATEASASPVATSPRGPYGPAPLSPSQRKLLTLTEELAAAQRASASAAAAAARESAHVEQLRTRIRAVVSRGRAQAAAAGLKGPQAVEAASSFFPGAWSYDAHDSAELKREWGLDSDVSNTFKRRLEWLSSDE